jgi:ankyrin repeat protein
MSKAPQKRTTGSANAGSPRLDWQLLQSAYTGDLTGVRDALAAGANVNIVHEQTGLTALHIAIGTNNLVLTRYLIEEADAEIGPDRSGRWPTIIAAECEVDAILSDYILEAEANISRV